MGSAGRDELCNSWCRICLKLDFNLDIFGQTCREKDIVLKLNTCFSLKISERDDKRTHKICLLCFLTLEATYDMRLKALRSDKILSDLLQLNNSKSQNVAASSSTEMAPPEQKKIKVRSSTNLTGLDEVPVINSVDPQKRKTTVKKENESHQVNTLQLDENGENLQPAKQKLYKQITQKVKPVNRFGDLEGHEQIIENSKPLAQTPRFKTPKKPALFSAMTNSPPMGNLSQRKRPREKSTESINQDANGELLINSVSSTPNSQKSVLEAPKRNFSQNPHISIPPQKSKGSHKQSKELLPDNNTSTKTHHILGKNSRSPLTEKVILIENCSAIDMHSPKTHLKEKKLMRKDSKIAENAKSSNIIMEEKKEGRGPSKRDNLENVSGEITVKNVDEPSIENMEKTSTTIAREAIDRCVNLNRAEIRAQTPSKIRRAEELARKTKHHQEKMKRLDKEYSSKASKGTRDVFEFTESPTVETTPRFTHVKRTAKRPTLIDSSEICFETRTAKNDEEREPAVDKNVQQDNLASSKDYNSSSTIHEELDSSIGSSRSKVQKTSVKSMTKLLPPDVCESWKKTAGTWESQNISTESEDSVNEADLKACMATGDIFGASIARKMGKKYIKNNKMNESAEEKIHNVKTKGTSQGIILLPSPLSTPSSAEERPKSSISSLNLSSDDESLKTCDITSAPVEENPIPVTKIAGKCSEAKQENSNPPVKLVNSQPKASNAKKELPGEESSESDTSDFHLTPKYMQ